MVDNAFPNLRQTEFDIWHIRWMALDQHLAALEQRILNAEGLDRKEVLAVLVKGLRDFAQDHFCFFYNGFAEPDDTEAERTLFERSEKFPPSFVFRQVIDRISEDFAVLQQCVEDRLPSNNEGRTVLQKADLLAYAALKPMIDKGTLAENTTVITYFYKKATLRVIPYANVALVSIPLTALGTDLDYMALYHEVGHYVYRHAKIRGTAGGGSFGKVKLAQRMSKIVGKDNWLQKWKEELFADIYGALMGGFGLALDFQYMEDEGSDEQFTVDDGDHPISAIRPEIYLKVLEAQGDEGVAALAERLRARWESILKQRGQDHPNSPFLIMKTEFVKPNVQAKQAVIEKITEVIREIIQIPELPVQNPRLIPIGSNLVASVLDSVIEGELIASVQTVDAQKLNPPLAPIAWDTWITDCQFNFDLTDNMLPKDQWLDVLDGNGWRTEGPNPRPSDDPG